MFKVSFFLHFTIFGTISVDLHIYIYTNIMFISNISNLILSQSLSNVYFYDRNFLLTALGIRLHEKNDIFYFDYK